MSSAKTSITPKGTMALVALAAVYGIMGVVARYLSSGIGLFEQWYLRLGIAFLVTAVLFHTKISWRKFSNLPVRDWLVLLFRVVVCQMIGIAFYTLAAEKTEIGVLAFMSALPISSLLGVLLFREKLNWQRAVLLALSFFGALIIVVHGFGDVMHFDLGALLAFLATVFFSLMLVGRRWHTDRLNNYEITAAMLAIASVSAYILSVVLYGRPLIPSSHWNIDFTLVVFAGGLLSAASIYLANYGFEHVSAVVAGNLLTLEEFFGPLFGYIFYSETLGTRDILGGILILISVILMNRIARRDRQQIQVAIVPD